MSDKLNYRLYFGAQYDLSQLIDQHIFIVCPNNSGSTLLRNIIATSSNVWSLPKEGQAVAGRSGMQTRGSTLPLLWASDEGFLAMLRDPANYCWETIKQRWYFFSNSEKKDAALFLEKSPPSLVWVDQLSAHFKGARFIFMVRNPYAVVEGIYRRVQNREGVEKALRLATTHVLKCMELQRRNIEKYQDTGCFFTYEALTGETEKTIGKLLSFCPELEELSYQEPIGVKGLYRENIRNMNDDQIMRLSESQIETISEALTWQKDLLDFFGYELL